MKKTIVSMATLGAVGAMMYMYFNPQTKMKMYQAADDAVDAMDKHMDQMIKKETNKSKNKQ